MARLSARRVRELGGIRDYLAARRIEVKENLNTAKGLTSMIATLDAVLRTHATLPDVEPEIALLDVSGLTLELGEPRSFGLFTRPRGYATCAGCGATYDTHPDAHDEMACVANAETRRRAEADRPCGICHYPEAAHLNGSALMPLGTMKCPEYRP